jgi:hypothetical protein
MSRSREGLPASYHDREGAIVQGQCIRTEFGADAWPYAMHVGFTNVQIVALDYPVAHALFAQLKAHRSASPTYVAGPCRRIGKQRERQATPARG